MPGRIALPFVTPLLISISVPSFGLPVALSYSFSSVTLDAAFCSVSVSVPSSLPLSVALTVTVPA